MIVSTQDVDFVQNLNDRWNACVARDLRLGAYGFIDNLVFGYGTLGLRPSVVFQHFGVPVSAEDSQSFVRILKSWQLL